MKELKPIATLFQKRVPKLTLEKWHKEIEPWIHFQDPKLKVGDVIKVIDETNLSNYSKFEVLYIGEARVNIKLIRK